jgi:hypothetical protein
MGGADLPGEMPGPSCLTFAPRDRPQVGAANNRRAAIAPRGRARRAARRGATRGRARARADPGGACPLLVAPRTPYVIRDTYRVWGTMRRLDHFRGEGKVRTPPARGSAEAIVYPSVSRRGAGAKDAATLIELYEQRLHGGLECGQGFGASGMRRERGSDGGAEQLGVRLLGEAQRQSLADLGRATLRPVRASVSEAERSSGRVRRSSWRAWERHSSPPRCSARPAAAPPAMSHVEFSS